MYQKPPDVGEELEARGVEHSQAMWTLSSATRMTLEATTPTVMRASARRLAGAVGESDDLAQS
jgi:hypothetical protein